MSLISDPETAKMMRGTEDMSCTECGKNSSALIQYTTKSADMFMCENCAHTMSRILLQDILHLQTGHEVSLLGIMHHGRKTVEGRPLPKDQRPNGKSRGPKGPNKGSQNGLFDL